MSERYQIIHTDNLEWLKSRPDNSIDSVVTDGPYGLGKEPDPVKCLTAWIHHGYYEVGGAGFMNQKWDAFVPQPAFWKEVIRVLKPGGHVLSFSSTRTYDWMVMAMRLAGFEIRDQLCWIYGGGFPKSLNISLSIQKSRKEDLEPIRRICRAIRKKMDENGLKSRDLTTHFGDCHPRLIDHWAARDTDSQPSLPTVDQWTRLKQILSIGDDLDMEVFRLNERKGDPSDEWNDATVLGVHGGVTPGLAGTRFEARDSTIRTPTDEAKEWDGWGTALSPSHEPIVMARKPLEGTVAENVLKWGVGGLNINGCRVSTLESLNGGNGGLLSHVRDGKQPSEDHEWAANESGRWPSNLIIDESGCVYDLFPENTKSGDILPHHVAKESPNKSMSGKNYERTGQQSLGPQGSAARYFYCAKPSQYERSLGVQGLQTAERGNHHPTVKPVALMHHLVTMVTPPNGICLDPYCGSGTTGIGAMLAGPSIRFIGLDYTEEYIPIIMGRLKNWKKYRQFVEVTPDSPKARQKTTASPGKQQTLF